MTDQRPLDEFEKKIVENIEQFGCQVNHIFDPDGNAPGFSYSIGFPETVGQPEVIVFGLDSDVMHSMINETLRQCRAGLQLKDGVRVSDLIEGFDCVARSVDPTWIMIDYFNSAMWHHRWRTGQSLAAAVQLVWPGALVGLYPWDDHCAQEVIEAQPALYEARVVA